MRRRSLRTYPTTSKARTMDTERRRRPRRRSHWDGVLGMNARNALLASTNPPSAVRLVNRKYETKLALAAADIAVAPTLGVADSLPELRALVDILPDAWAIKPNAVVAGGGILISRSKASGRWMTPGGSLFCPDDIFEHGRRILEGEYSMGNVDHDLLLAEPLLVAHDQLAAFSPAGLPDVRVIVHRGQVLAAMLRLATIAGDGKANLHQGGIGVAIDVESGRTIRAVPSRTGNRSPPRFRPDVRHDRAPLGAGRRHQPPLQRGNGSRILRDRRRHRPSSRSAGHRGQRPPRTQIQNACRYPLAHYLKRDPTKVGATRS